MGLVVAGAFAATGPATPSLTPTPNASPTNSATETFTFSSVAGTGSAQVVGYQCSLNGAAFTACASPKSYSGLTDGSYAFQVESLNKQGTPSSPASYSWVVDRTPPALVAITRTDASPSKANPLRFTLTFSEPVSGAAAGNFAAVKGAGVSGTPTVGTPSPNGGSAPQATWTVPVGTTGLSGTGASNSTVGLNLTSGAGISDRAGNTLSTSSRAGATYVFDTTVPTASSITRAGASPTNAASVSWTVTFNEAVAGVASGNFSLLQSGLSGTPAITTVSGSGTAWTVTASDGSGTPLDGSAGTLQLNLSSTSGITDLAGNGLASTLSGSSAVYSIDRFTPAPALNYKPDDPNGDGIANFNWTEQEAGDTFRCSIENGAFTACPASGGYMAHYIVDVSNDGTHQFAVKATDALGNTNTTNYSWKVLHAVNVVVYGDANGLLYPGGPTRTIPLVLHNPNNFPLTINYIIVSVSASPSGCDWTTNVVIQQSNVDGNGPTVIVPANGDVTLPAQGATAPTIRMIDSGNNQDACYRNGGGVFKLTYLAKGSK